MTVRILQGDCRRVLTTLPDESVHCVVTSPPYWGLRDYGVAGQIGLEHSIDAWVAEMVAVFHEVRRVLRSDGTLWLNLGDSYNTGTSAPSKENKNADHGQWANSEHLGRRRANVGALKPKDLIGQPWRVAFALQADGWWLRQEIIWHKPNPMPESIRDRCTKAHEQLFLLAKSERYYYDFEAMQEPVTGGAHARNPGNKTHKYVEAREGGDERYQTKRGLIAYSERIAAAAVGPRDVPPGNPEESARAQCVRDVGIGHNARPRKGVPNDRKLADKDAGRDEQGLKHSEKFGRGAGWRTKNNSGFDEAMAVMPDMRNRRSVWTVGTEPFREAHFATFPPALIEPCIKAGCPEGGTVLDPFFGAGTTGLVADRLQRDCIGIELNPTYIEIAERRIRGDAPLFAEVAA